MSFPFPRHRRKVSGEPSPPAHLLRLTTCGFPRTLTLPSPPSLNADSLRVRKLLFNVTIENSLGPVPVLMSPDHTVADLVKAALLIYDAEKRRPFLKLKDPNRYALHYSPFCLESLKPDDKLRNLESRNFFLCSRPSSTSSCSEEANLTDDSAIPFMLFVHLLL